MEAVGMFFGYVIFYLIFALIFVCVYLAEFFAYLSLPVCLVCFIAALLLHYFCRDHLQWHWYLPFVATCIAILWALSCGADVFYFAGGSVLFPICLGILLGRWAH